MATAREFAERSTCDRLHVGAVIARNGRIVTTGYNGAAAGMPHCEHTYEEVKSDFYTGPLQKLYTTRDGLGSVTYEPTTDMTCPIAVHAEVNAIAYAARFGISTDACDLITTHSPCLACAKLIVNAGICRVLYGQEYRDPRGINLLTAAEIEVELHGA
jgi:dCMP deaminase